MLELLKKQRCDTPSEWVEENLAFNTELSPNLPGRVSLARQPWMREILACFLDPSITELHLVMGAQTGKTTACLLGSALLTMFDPMPLLWALPTDELALRMGKRRLLPFYESNEVLASHLPEKRDRNITNLPLDNMNIYVVGSRRPAKIASIPCGCVICDEEAKFDHIGHNEAHPVLLLTERTKAFARKLIVHASTPNTENNIFWQGFLKSDQRYYYIPCPHCGEFQKLEFTRQTVLWEHPKDTPLTPDIVQNTAYYACQKCHARLYDGDLRRAMQKGKWIAENPSASSSHRGYHVNSLYSPFITIGEFAREFWKSNDSQADIENYQNFVNSWLALPYVPYSYKVTDENISALAGEHFKGVSPFSSDETHYIVTCYDPGQNETHWVTCAVATGGRFALVDYGTVLSISDIPEHFRTHTIIQEGKPVGSDIGYCDSGDWTSQVYDECLSTGGVILPSKGSPSRVGVWAMTQIKTHPGLDLITYNDFALKRLVYGQMIQRREGGEIILPKDMGKELVDGLSGQTLIRKKGGGYQWKDLARDHFGDCLKLCVLSYLTLKSSLELED